MWYGFSALSMRWYAAYVRATIAWARVGARAAELVHHDGHPVQLDAARVLDDRDADRARRVRRGDGESSEPEDCNEDRTDGPHRRPRIHRIKVRTTLSRSDVASGK